MRVFVIGWLCLLTACGYYHEVKDGQSGQGALTGGTMGFASVKAAVFDPYCIACHGQNGAGGVSLETYARVLPLKDAIRSSVVSGRMPKRSTLPEREKSILLAWIDAGAPENSNLPLDGGGNTGGVPPPPPPPSPVLDFATVKSQIFQPQCVGCHSTFATYRAVKSSLRAIESKIMSNQMPPQQPLSQDQKSLLSRWIQAGAPETVGGVPPPPPDEIQCPESHGGDDDDDPCEDDDDDDDDDFISEVS